MMQFNAALASVFEPRRQGYLAGEYPRGTTTKNGVPCKARIWVTEAGTYRAVASTLASESGTWLVTGLDLNQRYNVVARDLAQEYSDVVAVRVAPTPLNTIATMGEFSSNADFNGVAGQVELVGGLPPYTASVISPLPSGLSLVLDGHVLRIDGTSMEVGIWDCKLRVESSNAVALEIPVHFEIKVLYVHATGGEETVIEVNGERYRVHTFNSSGKLNVISGGIVEYLLVAGGAAGGAANAGGGGGGGGVLPGALECAAGEYGIVVGLGGVGSGAWDAGRNGEDSTAFGKTVKGGGGGGQSQVSAARGKDGGSGGGSGGRWAESVQPSPASGISGQGHAGGIWNFSQEIGTTNRAGAGGGGAGGPGGNAGNGVGGAGGPGLETFIRGLVERFGGGGGGGSNGSVAGVGGTGGGGAGGREANGQPGTPNTGGGGGGTGSGYGSFVAGSGGSGVVIVRYRIANGL